MIWPLVSDVWRLTISGLSFVTPPVIETYAGGFYEYRALADFHASRRPLRYRLTEGPEWLQLDGRTGVLRGVVPSPGDLQIGITASDGVETSRQEYTLHVLPL
jgi:hypothetical protein